MRTHKRQTCVLLAFFVAVAAGARGTFAQPTSESAAAILTHILLVDTADGTDTVFQLSNTSTAPANVQCFYQDTTGVCSSSSEGCGFNVDCPLEEEICVPQCGGFTNFLLTLTPGQPIGWRASQGLLPLPCDAEAGGPCGPGSDFNAGSVPPVPPLFLGILRCIVVNALGAPLDSNVLEGTATLVQAVSEPAPHIDTVKQNAMGLRAIADANNGDGFLEIGGPTAEYAGCPLVNIVTHFFDGAVDPVATETITRIRSFLQLVPCGVDTVFSTPTDIAVHLVTFNEFEQRVGTSLKLGCVLVASLSSIHPTLFQVGTQGTMSGQTLIYGVNGGMLAGLAENHLDALLSPDTDGLASVPAHHRGLRATADEILIPVE